MTWLTGTYYYQYEEYEDDESEENFCLLCIFSWWLVTYTVSVQKVWHPENPPNRIDFQINTPS